MNLVFSISSQFLANNLGMFMKTRTAQLRLVSATMAINEGRFNGNLIFFDETDLILVYI
jgi:hypothetical protein